MFDEIIKAIKELNMTMARLNTSVIELTRVTLQATETVRNNKEMK